MTNLAVVTTFPPNRWTAYAKRMLQSHVDFWPDDVVLHAYYEGDKPNFQNQKINEKIGRAYFFSATEKIQTLFFQNYFLFFQE